MRGPSALLAARTACITKQGQRGLEPDVRAAPPQLGWGTGGGTGFGVRWDRSPAGPTTLHVGVTAKGFLGPHSGAVGPPRSVTVCEAWVVGRGKGHSRP